MINYYEPNLDLTLLGCGFLGPYHIGAIYLLSQIWPQKPYNRICGSSCGGVLGALVVAGVRLEVILDESMNMLRELSKLKGSIVWLVERSLDRALPHDAHKLCTNRLGISVTKLLSFENKFVSQFESRQDLIQAILAGCYVPVWGGLTLPRFRGDICVDGAYTDNTPKFALVDEDRRIGVRQVTICPFPSKTLDVSPPDKRGIFMAQIMGTCIYFSWNNFVRTNHTIIPLSPVRYKKYLLGGYQDMKEFVLKSNLVKCHDCYRKISMQSKRLSDQDNSKSSCLLCLRLLEKVDSLKIPDVMLKSVSR